MAQGPKRLSDLDERVINDQSWKAILRHLPTISDEAAAKLRDELDMAAVMYCAHHHSDFDESRSQTAKKLRRLADAAADLRRVFANLETPMGLELEASLNRKSDSKLDSGQHNLPPNARVIESEAVSLDPDQDDGRSISCRSVYWIKWLHDLQIQIEYLEKAADEAHGRFSGLARIPP
jgi:hypothetical protein